MTSPLINNQQGISSSDFLRETHEHCKMISSASKKVYDKAEIEKIQQLSYQTLTLHKRICTSISSLAEKRNIKLNDHIPALKAMRIDCFDTLEGSGRLEEEYLEFLTEAAERYNEKAYKFLHFDNDDRELQLLVAQIRQLVKGQLRQVDRTENDFNGYY
jgi:hypothetical protein